MVDLFVILTVANQYVKRNEDWRFTKSKKHEKINIDYSTFIDVEPDISSSVSNASTCSSLRRSTRIAKQSVNTSLNIAHVSSIKSNKSTDVTDRQQVIEAAEIESIDSNIFSVTTDGQFICGVGGCKSVHQTKRGLSVHRSRKHGKKMNIDYSMLSDIEPDSTSPFSNETNCSSLRRSTRIAEKKTQLSKSHQLNSDYTQSRNSTSTNEIQIHIDDSTSDTQNICTSHDNKSDCELHFKKNIGKGHLLRNYTKKITDLEKELPSVKSIQRQTSFV